jgi:hypothetical protein
MDHHGRPSFRVKDKIFSTIWDEFHLNVMLDPLRIRDMGKRHSHMCKEIWWGQRLACVQVDIRYANLKFVRSLMREAWQRKAA